MDTSFTYRAQNDEKWAVMGLELLWAVCGF